MSCRRLGPTHRLQCKRGPGKQRTHRTGPLGTYIQAKAGWVSGETSRFQAWILRSKDVRRKDDLMHLMEMDPVAALCYGVELGYKVKLSWACYRKGNSRHSAITKEQVVNPTLELSSLAFMRIRRNHHTHDHHQHHHPTSTSNINQAFLVLFCANGLPCSINLLPSPFQTCWSQESFWLIDQNLCDIWKKTLRIQTPP